MADDPNAEDEQHPRASAHYRCPVCRLDLTLDPKTDKLTVTPMGDADATDSAHREPR
ncbi:MAG: hypothetical protein JF610_10940 [Acidobacteria bacterium]|nr:hypothetical protein [Acidobacteriota bacterium]